jgi:hypothetical protein
MMLIQTMMGAARKAAHEYFGWHDAEGLSPTTREAQSQRARRELIRLGQELLPVLPEPAVLIRFLAALNDDADPDVEEELWHVVQVEMSKVSQQPALARQPQVPIVWWSQKWGWEGQWAPGAHGSSR